MHKQNRQSDRQLATWYSQLSFGPPVRLFVRWFQQRPHKSNMRAVKWARHASARVVDAARRLAIVRATAFAAAAQPGDDYQWRVARMLAAAGLMGGTALAYALSSDGASCEAGRPLDDGVQRLDAAARYGCVCYDGATPAVGCDCLAN
jgi:hypothetical protein